MIIDWVIKLLNTSFFSGAIVALAGVWLTKRLDNQKIKKETMAQKACEIYLMTQKIFFLLDDQYYSCYNLIKDQQWEKDTTYLTNERKKDIGKITDKFEMLVVSGFRQFKQELYSITNLVLKHQCYLYKASINYKTYELASLQTKHEKYHEQLQYALHELQDKLESHMYDKPSRWHRFKNWLATRRNMSPKKSEDK
jgi:hypothetical protein